MMVRKFLTVLIGLMFITSAYAVSKNDYAVSMVSYEQSWLDDDGTIALRNNTDETINNVAFQITYLDMKGNALDYEKFYRKVVIDPGMTKKLNLPAYEHGRNYHYYKTKDEFGHPAFKIDYKLINYNALIESDVSDDLELLEDSTSTYNGILFSFGILIVILIFTIGLTVGLYVLVAVMAKKRNRNVVAWVLLSILATPLLMAIILLVIGDNEEYETEYIETTSE